MGNGKSKCSSGDAVSTRPKVYTVASLLEAISNGAENDVLQILRVNPSLCNQPTGPATSQPVLLSITKDSPNILSLLLEAGADPDKTTDEGNSAAIIACNQRNVACLRLLINKNCNVNAHNLQHIYPIHVASIKDSLDCVKALLQAYADVNARDNEGNSPLDIAMQKGADSIMRVLCASPSIDFSQKDTQGFNSLHKGARRGCQIVVDEICRRRPDLVNVKKSDGYTALHLCVLNNYPNCVKSLLAAGADINITNDNGESAAFIAVRKKKFVPILEILLAQPSLNPELTNNDGATIFHLAAGLGKLPVVRKLLEVYPQNMAHPKTDAKSGNTSPLHSAIYHKHQEVVQMILEHNPELDCVDKDGDTPLHIAISHSTNEIAMLVLLSGSADISLKNKKGFNSLHMAARKGSLDLAEIMLQMMPDKSFLNIPKDDGFTALHLAAANGHLALVSMLVEAGADVNVTEKEGKTPLIVASEARNSEPEVDFLQQLLGIRSGNDNEDGDATSLKIIELLLNHGAQVNTLSTKKHSALQCVANRGKVKCLQLLLDSGADVNVQDFEDDTPLHDAIMQNEIETCKILLSCDNFNSDVRNKRGFNCLQWAAFHGRAEIFELCLKKFPELRDTRTAETFSTLHIAAINGHDGIVLMLVEAAAELEVVNKEGVTPLMLSVLKGKQSTAELLILREANLKAKDKNGSTVLHYACSSSNPEMLDMLLNQDVLEDCINSQNSKRETPIHVAVKEKNAACVSLLLGKGARVDLCDEGGNTALHLAISNKSLPEIMLRLVRASTADPSIRNNAGFAPLHWAAREGNAAAVKELLDRFPDLVNESKTDGYTALHLAACNNHQSVTERLLAAGADLEARTYEGQTALLVAASNGFVKMIEFLESKGCNINAVDDRGNSAAHLSLQQMKNPDMRIPDNAELLKPVLRRLPSMVRDRSETPLPSGMLVSAWLLERGISITSCNREGETPLDLLEKDKEAQKALSHYAKLGKSQCVICASDKADVLFEPCGHRVCCQDCCKKMRRCIQCGERIETKKFDDGQSENTKPDTTGNDATAAETEELAKLREELTCLVCLDRKRTLVFNCGHSSCEECAESLKLCHMCREPIHMKIKLF